MLAQDVESGYTPLHIAVIKRDLISLMILLGHASSSLDGNINTQQMLHPLRLLDGNLDTNMAGENENQFNILNALNLLNISNILNTSNIWHLFIILNVFNILKNISEIANK